ncbi:unnamed protein product, partial [Mesorhabditis belari]|uniref:Methyltransferase HEMK2 n=1 Tax=Mesorhabditis belari TaxID=2138241 RepID=A0AAF3EFI0_9BILA
MSEGLPTPDYSLSIEQRESVYEPAEDTFLLLDALEKDIKKLRALDARIVLEIGCGSGVVSTFVAQNLGKHAFHLGTDINFVAARCTRQTARMNRIELDTIQTDLIRGLRLDRVVDILLFNPPYVPTESEATTDIERTWAGGPTGRGTLDRFLPEVPRLLSSQGVFYLVALHQNDIPSLLNHNEKELKGEIVMQRRCGIEHLYILKFSRI